MFGEHSPRISATGSSGLISLHLDSQVFLLANMLVEKLASSFILLMISLSSVATCVGSSRILLNLRGIRFQQAKFNFEFPISVEVERSGGVVAQEDIP